MKSLACAGALSLSLALAAGCGRAPAAEREVLVFAAASLREAMQELAAEFEEETAVRVVLNLAGSNDLARQIRATHGADLFLSASETWMDTVEAAGRLVPGTRRDLLSGTLVVVARAGTEWTVEEPCDLAALPFDHLALADPEAVPAGSYAREWLRSVRCAGSTLWDAVAGRVAPAPDVRAALGLALADPDVAAIVYRTDQLAFGERTRVLHEVRGGPPVRYVLAQVTGGRSPGAAARFHRFLSGPRGARAFARHGFIVLPSSGELP